jgi:hypothetical protein
MCDEVKMRQTSRPITSMPLRVWFYNPVNDTEGIVNKIVALADPPFCHCELQFPDDTACSIYMGTSVVMKKRSFDTDHYHCIEVSTSRDRIDDAFRLCVDATNRNVRFSSLQMMQCIAAGMSGKTEIGHGSMQDDTFTFCSKLVTSVLLDSNVVPCSIRRNPTPSELYRWLTSTNADLALCQPADDGPCPIFELEPGTILNIL